MYALIGASLPVASLTKSASLIEMVQSGLATASSEGVTPPVPPFFASTAHAADAPPGPPESLNKNVPSTLSSRAGLAARLAAMRAKITFDAKPAGAAADAVGDDDGDGAGVGGGRLLWRLPRRRREVAKLLRECGLARYLHLAHHIRTHAVQFARGQLDKVFFAHRDGAVCLLRLTLRDLAIGAVDRPEVGA